MSITDSTQILESWVKHQIQTSQNAATDAIMTAVADVISSELKTCQKAEEDIALLRHELAALKSEVAELRGNSGFAQQLMALRSAWPNWNRHWHGLKPRANEKISAATGRNTARKGDRATLENTDGVAAAANPGFDLPQKPFRA